MLQTWRKVSEGYFQKENSKRELLYVWWRIMGKSLRFQWLISVSRERMGNIMPGRENNLCKGPELNHKWVQRIHTHCMLSQCELSVTVLINYGVWFSLWKYVVTLIYNWKPQTKFIRLASQLLCLSGLLLFISDMNFKKRGLIECYGRGEKRTKAITLGQILNLTKGWVFSIITLSSSF